MIALGEALVDFTPLDEDNMIFRKNPGGAPANVAVAASRLGAEVSFIGKLGDDVLGRFMEEKLSKEEVNTDNVLLTKQARTALTFVTLDQNGERSFDFYINPSADRLLTTEEIKDAFFRDHDIFHFGSISLIEEPAREATKYAVKLARRNNLLISYDPNLRINLWPNKQVAKEQIMSVLDQIDLLKVSKKELEFITGESDLELGIKSLMEISSIPLVFVTVGEKGAYYYQENLDFVSGYQVEAVDTTGAGDAFVAGILYNLNKLNKNLSELTDEDLNYMTRFANIFGALTTTETGAMSALPKKEQVKTLINND